MNVAAEITPAKLRAGDPGALAALCDRRGAAILAYCQDATGRDDAAAVAAEAFAEFRTAILPSGTLRSKGQAETLLRGVTRRAALVHADERADGEPPAPGGCDGREAEILAYVENSLSPADREVVVAHVGHCRSCAAVLERLESAEQAFKLKHGSPLPRSVAREILTAMVRAAPVSAHEGDADAVIDEALRLLTGDDASPDPEPEAGLEPSELRTGAEPEPEPEPELAEPAPQAAAPQRGPAPDATSRPPPEREPVTATAPAKPPVRPRPMQPPVPPKREPAAIALARLRERLAWSPRDPLGPHRSSRLLRSAARLAVVVVAAGAAGTLLGVGIAALTGGGETAPSGPGVPTAQAPATTRDLLPVEVTSTTVRPATIEGEEGSSVSVRVRVENASDRAVRPKAPRLMVDELRVAAEPDSVAAAGGLLSPSLDSGAVAEGTLRFELRSRTPSELATARVRLRVGGKIVVLTPVLDETPAPG